MIRFHPEIFTTTRWIGVDLNTTGHAVVAADPVTGTVMKLGRNHECAQTSSVKKCTKLYHENKLWKLARDKSRQKKEFRAVIHRIARRIVAFASALPAGIRFEKLFTGRKLSRTQLQDCTGFSFDNGSFPLLLSVIEKRARSHGIPVQYVNPLNTSKKCSRCGGFGDRVRKRFVCPHCGRTIHADVNAALNIAAAPVLNETREPGKRAMRRMLRKRARSGLQLPTAPRENPYLPDTLPPAAFFWKDAQAAGNEAG